MIEVWVKITLTMWVICLSVIAYSKGWQEIYNKFVIRAVSILLLISYVSSILLSMALVWTL